MGTAWTVLERDTVYFWPKISQEPFSFLHIYFHMSSIYASLKYGQELSDTFQRVYWESVIKFLFSGTVSISVTAVVSFNWGKCRVLTIQSRVLDKTCGQ